MICPGCGHNNSDTLHFCTRCGIRIKEKEEDVVIISPQSMTQEDSHRRSTRENIPTEVAHSNPAMFNKRFIPSQVLKDKQSRSFIVELEETTIVIKETSKRTQPWLVIVDGKEYSVTPSKKKTEVQFKTRKSNHVLSLWNGAASNFFFMALFWQRGVAVAIDGIPVRNTLADPLLVLKEGRVAIWMFTALLAFKAAVITILSNNAQTAIGAAIVYGVAFLFMLVAAISFRINPRIALWGGLIFGILETIDFFSIIFMSDPSIGSIKINPAQLTITFYIWGSLRLGLLYAMVRSLKSIKKILE